MPARWLPRSTDFYLTFVTQLTVLSVGTLKEDYLVSAAAEYKKRLGALCRVEEVNLREEKILHEDSPAAVAAALEAEGERMLAKIPTGAYRIALCVEGESFGSEALAGKLGSAADRYGKIALLIGSSHGLSPRVKAAADLRLSISPLTFPHQLMRVLLFEILYRSFSICAGTKYHK